MADQNKKTDRAPRSEIYRNESGNVTVSTYDFVPDSGPNAGQALKMVELVKVRREWDKEKKAYYEKRSFVSMSSNEFHDLLAAVTK